MIFAGREDVEILLNEKMKGENNMAFKVAPPHLLLLLSWLQPELVSLELDLFHPDYGKGEQMMDGIHQEAAETQHSEKGINKVYL
ncbi:hypothetical protein EJB05_02838, partial [Eragrostis curvula]